MGYRADALSAAKWEGITDEQKRKLKLAYLMGANDALKIAEGNIGSDLVTDDLSAGLIGTMDQRLGFLPDKATGKS